MSVNETRKLPEPILVVPSAVLARLIEEVADHSIASASAYNRTYNRHNR